MKRILLNHTIKTKPTEQSLVICMELDFKLNWKPRAHSNIPSVSHGVLPESNTVGNKNS